MNTNIFICQLHKNIQNKIEKLVTNYLKENDCFTQENLNNIMNDRFENLNVEGFQKQFHEILKEIV
ncbi:hypothetical protein FCV38_11945 [Clostridium sporogenes]|nr:hypothetical protein [Clostridium sporogenes]